MSVWSAWLSAVGVLAAMAVMGWVLSLLRRDVGVVDSLWGLFFAAAAITYAATLNGQGLRSGLVLALCLIWALRLTSYITWRNWGEPEDRRYAAMRDRNQPHFELKSLYLIFGLQATIAAVVSLPLLGAMAGQRPLGVIDLIGVLLWGVGLTFEALGDWQLSRFKADPDNKVRVLDHGLWRYTRHPNYFGDFCVWWGFYLLALGAGAWWAILGPALMTVLLLRVSGVTLLESDIAERRPGYQVYVRRTNAFFPGLPRES